MTTIEMSKTAQKGNSLLFNTVMANTKVVGNKEFASVPVELLFADPDYQRIITRSKEKIYYLAKNWSDNKMDALRVVPHLDEKTFAIVDGYGRYTANSIRNGSSETLPCMFIQGAPNDPEERKKFEAKLFVEQNLEMETLTPVQKHYANLLIGDKAATILENICNEYEVQIVTTKGTR